MESELKRGMERTEVAFEAMTTVRQLARARRSVPTAWTARNACRHSMSWRLCAPANALTASGAHGQLCATWIS